MEIDLISSSSDEYDFPASDDDESAALISGGYCRETGESSGEDSDGVRGARRKKMRITEVESDVESEIESEAGESAVNSTWVPCGDSDEVATNVGFRPGDNPTSQRIMSNAEEPIDFFQLFFTHELVDEITRQTNANAKRKLDGKMLSPTSTWRNWRDVTNDELRAFLAVVINMGTMPLSNIQEYWSRNVVSHVPFYPETFARDRFGQIFWMLHPETEPKDADKPRKGRQRVNCFLDYLNSKFLDCFIPGEHIRVHESTIQFRGRISFTTRRNPKKPTKRGIRVYALDDSKTGYICCFLPYSESLPTELLFRPDLPISSRIPIHLYRMLLGKIPGSQGHHMYTDRYHTSCALARELAKLKCNFTGRIRTNGKGLPNDIKKAKFSEKSTIAYRQGNILVLGWKDKGIVTCLTTKGDTGMTTVKRITGDGADIMLKTPNIVLNYVKYMGGVDRASHHVSSYCFLRKSLKRWRKLFFWGMEMSLVNSYVLYKEEKIKRGERPVSHLRFRKTLVEQLRGSHRRQREQASTSHSDEIRLNGKLHVVLKGSKRDCKVCSDRSTPGGRREISYYCDTCPDKPRMHLGHCFSTYHTKTNYKV